jgi:hypothetical protein
MTAIVLKAICLPIKKLWNFALIAWFSLLEGCSVWLYYSVFDNYRIYVSILYGAYTFSIICAFGLRQILEPKTIEIQNEPYLELPFFSS